MNFTIKDKWLRLFIICGAMLTLFSFYPRTTDTADATTCQAIISYELELQKFYVFPDTSNLERLAPLEKVSLDPVTAHKQIEECLDDNNELTKTIYWLNPTESLQAWMPQISKTVLTRDKVELFDASDNLLLSRNKVAGEIAFSDSLAQHAALNGLGVPLSFAEVVTQDSLRLAAENFTFTNHPDGSIEATSPEQAVYIYPAEKKITRNYLEEDGTIRAVETNLYAEDENNELVPVEHNVETHLVFPQSGECAKLLVVQTFANYTRGSGLLRPIPDQHFNANFDARQQPHADEE